MPFEANNVNPLSFIRRVIPDTAAATNAETFKQQATLGLQNNKQAAAMKVALANISGRADNAYTAQGLVRGAPNADIKLEDARNADVRNTKAGTVNTLRDAGRITTAPNGASLADIENPKGGFDATALKGVAMKRATEEVTDTNSSTVNKEFFENNPDKNALSATAKVNTSDTKTRVVKNKNNQQAARKAFNASARAGEIVRMNVKGVPMWVQPLPNGNYLPVKVPD